MDNAILNAIIALNAFTGGDDLYAQANAVSAAGNTWQEALSKAISDGKKNLNPGSCNAADSQRISGIIIDKISIDAPKAFNLVEQKLPLFKSLGVSSDVRGGLQLLLQEFYDWGMTVEPHIQADILVKLRNAGSAIFVAANSAINAYLT